jgi:glycosyltransferase involved in cell wall biosynthesis
MNANDVLVSLILNIYNSGVFLDRCISSAIYQTHQNLEIILMDDGSTDNSKEISERYSRKDNRILYIRQKNTGVSIARNNAIDIAHGEYIIFADADDYLEYDYVEHLLELCLKYKVDVSVTTKVFSEKKHESKQVKKVKAKVLCGWEAAELILSYKMPIGPWNKCFKKEFLNNNKIRFIEGLFNGEGFSFNIFNFLGSERIAISNKRIYRYHQFNQGSGSTTFKESSINSGLKAQELIRNSVRAYIDNYDKKNYRSVKRRLEIACDYANWETHCWGYELMVLGNAEDKNFDLYNKLLYITKKEIKVAFKSKCSLRSRLYAFLMLFDSQVHIKLTKRRWSRFHSRKVVP